MLQKQSFFSPSDSSGVFKVKVIQTRRCSSRKHAKPGKFLRVVIKATKVRFSKKLKRRIRAMTIRSKQPSNRKDGTGIFFFKNAGVLLRRRMNALGKELIGPVAKEMKIKKFRKSFITMV